MRYFLINNAEQMRLAFDADDEVAARQRLMDESIKDGGGYTLLGPISKAELVEETVQVATAKEIQIATGRTPDQPALDLQPALTAAVKVAP